MPVSCDYHIWSLAERKMCLWNCDSAAKEVGRAMPYYLLDWNMKTIRGSTDGAFYEGLVWGKAHVFFFFFFLSHTWDKVENTEGTTFKEASPDFSKLQSTIFGQGCSLKIKSRWYNGSRFGLGFSVFNAVFSHFNNKCILCLSLLHFLYFYVLFCFWIF